MAFLDTLKEAITNKPSNLKEPEYIEKFNEDNKQINKLNELLKYAEEEQHNVIKEKIDKSDDIGDSAWLNNGIS